jgi:hypothetical protein
MATLTEIHRQQPADGAAGARRGGVPRGGGTSSKTSARATCGQGRRSGLGVRGRLVGMGDPDLRAAWTPHHGARGRALERGSAARRDIAGLNFVYTCLTDVFPKFSNKTLKTLNTKVVEQLYESNFWKGWPMF